MKLTEILGNTKKFTFKDYLDKVISKNANFIKPGSFGIAIQDKATNIVYKMWMVDHAYEKWIRYCIKNQGKYDCIPKIYSKKIHTLHNLFIRDFDAYPNFKIIKIEPLSPIPDNHTYSVKFPDEQTYNQETFNVICKYFMTCSTYHSATLLKFENESDQNMFDDILKVLFVDLTGSEYDLKPNNFMIRNGKLVIVDPIVDWQDINADYNQLPYVTLPITNNLISGKGKDKKVSFQSLVSSGELAAAMDYLRSIDTTLTKKEVDMIIDKPSLVGQYITSLDAIDMSDPNIIKTAIDILSTKQSPEISKAVDRYTSIFLDGEPPEELYSTKYKGIYRR